MTRETKLGLVVASSFLALVCGVVAVKSRFTSAPSVDEPKTLAQVTVTEVTQPEGLNDAPPAIQNFPVKDLSNVPVVKPSNLDPVVLPHVESPEIVKPVRADVPKIGDPLDVPIIVSQDNPPKKNSTIDPAVFIVPNSDKVEPIVAPPDPKIGDPIVPPERPKVKDDFSKKDKVDVPKKDDGRPVIKITIPKKETKPDALDQPPPLDIIEPMKPEGKNPTLRMGDEPKKDPPPIIVPSETNNAPIVIDLPVKKDAPRKIDTPKKDEPLRIEPTLVIEPSVKKDGKVVLDPASKNDVPQVIELNPKRDSPIVRPMKDTEYDEDLHSLKQNESYRSLSKQYYNSEAYAVALQRYNRDHPGQADYVRLPPIWVLEKKYASDVSANPAQAVKYSPPPPDASPRNQPIYTVLENGEMLAEIAKRTLGNEDAWKRIWDLNPQLNPAKTIPGGTRLQMPEGSRLP